MFPEWPPPAGSRGCSYHATSCVSLHHTGLHYKKFLPLPWILKVGKKQISQDGEVRLSRPTASSSGPMFCKYMVTYQLSALTVQRMRLAGDHFCSVNISKIHQKSGCVMAASTGSPRDQRIQRVCC